MAKSSREQLDKDERKILAELQKNSNEGIETIAKHCGFSRQKVWRTIKQLEKNRMIWGYTAVIDEGKIEQKHFILLMKRKQKGFEEKIVDTLISRSFEAAVAKMGITIETSSYIHGEYDWITTFLASDIRQAKQFCNSIPIVYPDVFERFVLIETLFDIKKQHILNPDVKKLKELL
ncbi:MAG: Lrp/AsnC family transcriptional regulator [Thermoplasmata archaeon]|nr:Lrp/AsnC family transcriptional regulator [Thermoplasmata archaeon]